jgi:uncharacterized RDD family membrane protein YckC
MTAHNPYAAPKAPVSEVSSSDQPIALGDEVEYGGFWRRVGAQILDALILAPLGILAYFGSQFSRLFYLYYVIPGILIALFYSVYLVKRYGGTPGKRILNMRIVMTDGSPVTGTAALWRYSVMLVLGTIPSIGMAVASLSIPAEGYETLGFLERMQLFTVHTPAWANFASYAIWGWIIVGIIVMLTNERRRATHDFIARTLVIRT